MSKPEFAVNDEGGVIEHLVFDGDGSFAVKYVGDPDPILDRNKELYNDGTGGWSASREMRRVATIPAEAQLEWFAKYGVKVWEKEPWRDGTIARLLDDSEWLHLRTAPGRIGRQKLRPVTA